MPTKPSQIWQNSTKSFPSKEEIYLYVDGKMDREQTLAFENRMADSPLLSDAIEGLLVEKSNNEAVISKINLQIEQKSSKKAKIVPFFNRINLSIAASILLFFTCGMLFFIFRKFDNKAEIASSAAEMIADSTNAQVESATNHKIEQNLAFVPAPTQALKPTLGKDHKSAAIEAEADISSEIKSNSEGNKPSESEAIEVQTPSLSPLAGKANSTDLLPDMTNIDADSAQNQAIATEMLAFSNTHELEEKKDFELEAKKDVPNAPARAKESALKKASKSEENAALKNANRENNKPFPSISQAKRLIEQQKFQEAINELNSVISQDVAEKEDALWLKVVCLLKLNNDSAAFQILNQLSRSSGIYASKASKILANLK
ncbi:MAG: hypothetical protein ACKVOU_14795 [Cytophagales bacterium]